MKPSEKCAKVLHELGLCRKEEVGTLALLIATHSGCDELLEALRRLRAGGLLRCTVKDAESEANAELAKWSDD